MMEKYCEYCVDLRAIVYCKSDAAYLCLSCDSKVHSANPLSNRHRRTLICECCRRGPTSIRCYDHHKFMCRGCDLSQHDASSNHRKRVVKSYVGCPSAPDLGLLWDFDLTPFVDHRLGLETNEHIMGIDGTGIQASHVLEQLVDLLKIQTSLMRCQEQEMENDDDQLNSHKFLGDPDHHDMNLDPCSLPFTQMDHLESSETTLEGDSFWQCKTSSFPSSQRWYQNMQDLGVCEEPSCLDDLNIPDIDLTFENFEDLFPTNQESTSIHPDTSMACMTLTESSPKKARYISQIMSFSFSSDTSCIDSGISPGHHETAKRKGKKKV